MFKKVIWAFVGLILFLLVLTGGFMAGSFYARPLAEPMVIKPAEVAQSEGACGQTGSQLVLFTGADFAMGNPPLGADAIRLARVDYDAKKIIIVSIPRDLVVKTPGLSDLNISESALGLAYQSRKEATQGDPRPKVTVATELLAQTLVDNFGYPADTTKYDYITLQIDEVGAMVDAIGGVPIDLLESITTEHKVTFPAGKQILDGALSVAYLRAIVPGGEPARLQRQNLYVKALQDQILTVGLLPKVPDLLRQFDKAIVTSLTPEQLQSLACMSEAVPTDQIEFHEISIANGLATAGEGELLVPNIKSIQESLRQWLGD